MVDRVIKLLDDHELRKAFCEHGMKTVRRFTWDKAATKLERVLSIIT